VKSPLRAGPGPTAIPFFVEGDLRRGKRERALSETEKAAVFLKGNLFAQKKILPV